jgi:hypothetical protein
MAMLAVQMAVRPTCVKRDRRGHQVCVMSITALTRRINIATTEIPTLKFVILWGNQS